MRIHHFLIALLVITIWGFNFVVVTLGMQNYPPLFLVAIRLFLTCFPIIFFVKKPNVPMKWIITYGLVMFALQFSLIFNGIYYGVSPGLASILHQTQVFFSFILAIFILKEAFNFWQVLGGCLAFSGVILIGLNRGGDVSTVGFLLVLGASLAWAFGNLILKKLGKVEIFSLCVWSSLAAFPVVLFASLLLEGPQTIWQSVIQTSWLNCLSILYLSYLSMLLAYSLWGWLIHQLPLTTVAPFSLLIPIVGILSSVLVLDEALPAWKIIASLLVILGLSISLFGARLWPALSFKVFFRNTFLRKITEYPQRC